MASGFAVGANTLASCRHIEGQSLPHPCRRVAGLRPRKQQRLSATTRAGPEEQQEKVASSTAFLLSVAALNSAVAGSALAADKAVSSAVQGPNSVPALVSASGNQAVDKAVSTAVDAVKATGGFIKSGLGVASEGFTAAKQTYFQVEPVVEDAVNKAAPYVKTAAKTVGDVAGPVVKAITPTVQSGLSEAERFLNRSGVQPDVLVRKGNLAAEQAGDVINRTSPQISQSLGSLSSADPTTLGKYALGLAALYFLGPTFLRTLFGTFRGYKGDITPAAALDALANDGNTILVDVRTAREKESSGIPDLPNSGKLIELEFANVDNRSTRGQLRNVNAVERTMTVLQIAALKKVGKGTTVLLMDKNGGGAKAIAKELSGRGFRKVFVVNGGFQGWTGSKLQTRLSTSVSAIEVLSPGNLFGTQRMANTQRNTQAGRRALPSGR
ncbi:hypothetical protein WJX84_008419 [Apatococcus fuscideae]|uniref:Rhodanese domain-containing protein n=1 Tax=Apatococcus fuscideae TaxID=2026836 RepID=A0AAW1TB97_9CHLO